MQVGDDPFTQQRKQKAQNMKAQEKRQLANMKASAKQGAAPTTLRLAAVLPEKGRGKPNKHKDAADDVRTSGQGVYNQLKWSMFSCHNHWPGLVIL